MSTRKSNILDLQQNKQKEVLFVTITERIFVELSQRNITQKDFANNIDVNEKTVSAWKKNNSLPPADKLSNISDCLGVSLDFLLTGKEKSPSLPDDEQELLNYYKKLPEREQVKLISRAETLSEIYAEQVRSKRLVTAITNIKVYEIAAGAGISTPFTDDDKYTIKEFPQTDVPSNADCGIYLNGDSMEPKFPNGSLVWVKETQDIKFGDIVIAILNGEPFCKIYQADGLYSVNPKYDPILVNENDTFSVFGRVLGYYVE